LLLECSTNRRPHFGRTPGRRRLATQVKQEFGFKRLSPTVPHLRKSNGSDG
jgi:hypothetical protein